jgi:hypothetical protein
VPKNRPQSGSLPYRRPVMANNGHTQFQSQVWYDNLTMHGNTSINPYFYGTYLAETKPNEPVTRDKQQVFQADAVGAIHQLTENHFKYMHTFRIEWQPGPGGRLDWFVRRHPADWTNMTDADQDEGEWLHALGIKDKSLKDLMGSQIPIEPSYIILNTAISSTWGFPYDAPSWCPMCFDCNNPQCTCRFSPGFCSMLEEGDVAMYVDSVRVYQSKNDDAHVGMPHTLGCDPPQYPTKEWIEGHAYRYSRSPPFSYEDHGPLHKIQKGGGSCQTDADCGSDIQQTNFTAMYERLQDGMPMEDVMKENYTVTNRGKCVDKLQRGMFTAAIKGPVCSCNAGFTGPHCLALEFTEKYPSAHEILQLVSPFRRIASFEIPTFMVVAVASLFSVLLAFLIQHVLSEKRTRLLLQAGIIRRPFPPVPEKGPSDETVASGASI